MGDGGGVGGMDVKYTILMKGKATSIKLVKKEC